MNRRATLASFSIALSVFLGLSSAHALSRSALSDADPPSWVPECTLLILVVEAEPHGLDRYFVHGTIIIPGFTSGGAYDPPVGAGPYPLEKALSVADSDSYHGRPCKAHPYGYPSCGVVNFRPLDYSQNVYSGSGKVHCD